VGAMQVKVDFTDCNNSTPAANWKSGRKVVTNENYPALTQAVKKEKPIN
jgi:hypothetical protein